MSSNSTSTPTRWVMVDDTSPDYQYTGAWFQARGNQDNLGNFGAPFQSTLHGINVNGTVKYTYQGSRVIVYGTSAVETINGVTDPDWSCSVDGVAITRNPPNLFPENNWIICSADSLSDGTHTITVNAIVRNQQTFWFDRIQYVPSASADLSNATVLVDAYDPAVKISSGWTDLDGIGYMTQQQNAKLTLNFTGSSLSWVSLIPSDQPRGSTSATYSIDGGTPTSFFLSGLQPTEMAQYNKVFFQTPQLSPGAHQLEVIHDGNSGVTPLTIDYFVVQNATIPTSSSSSSASQSSTSNSSNASKSAAPASSITSNSKKTPVGAIAGGVVGSIVLIIAMVLFFLIYRHREKKRKEKQLYGQVDLNMAPIEPFTDPSPMAASYSTQPCHPKFTPMASSPGTSSQTPSSSYNPPSGPSLNYDAPSTTSAAVSTSTVTNSSSNLLTSSKERSAQGSVSTRDEILPSAGTSRVLRHEDSGLRLPPQEEEEPLVELPPLYTPG